MASATPSLFGVTPPLNISTCSPARSADSRRPSQLGSPVLGDRGASWSERNTWSIRRSSRVVARLACSMSQSAATRRSGSAASTLRATAARTVIKPMPWETRSCRSRAIVNLSVVTAAAICWERSCSAWRRPDRFAAHQIQHTNKAADSMITNRPRLFGPESVLTPHKTTSSTSTASTWAEK